VDYDDDGLRTSVILTGDAFAATGGSGDHHWVYGYDAYDNDGVSDRGDLTLDSPHRLSRDCFAIGPPAADAACQGLTNANRKDSATLGQGSDFGSFGDFDYVYDYIGNP
jgi:hypothetical protein